MAGPVVSPLALARPRATLGAALLVTVALGAAAAGVETDNSLPVWLPAGDPELVAYEAFRARFGEDSFVLAAAALDPGRPDSARDDDRAAFDALARDLAALPGVARVERGLRDDPVGRLLTGPDLVGLLVAPRPDLPVVERAALIDAVAARAARAPWPVHLAGPEVVNHAMDRGSRGSFAALFPVVVAITGLVLWGALGAWRVAVAVLALALVACVWTVGALALTGRSLNMVVVIVPALLVVLGTAYALHLVSAVRGDDWGRAVDETLAPCLLTAVTTAAGLLSLCTSGLTPVRDLGAFGALGVLIAFVLTFTALPALFRLVPARLPARRSATPMGAATGDLPRRWAGAVAARAPLILATSAALLALAAVGVGRLRIESHVLRFFAPDHPLRAATAAIEGGLTGLTPLEVWLEGPAREVLSAPVIAAARGFLDDARAEADVLGAVSPLDHDPRLAGLSPLAATRALRLALDEGAFDEPALVHHVRRAGDHLAVRVTLACRTTESEGSLALSERLRARLDERFAGAPVEARLTGSMPLLVRVQAALVRTQVASFGTALLVVAALLLVVYRAPLLVAAALLPNVAPVVLTLGAMGWAGVPLDVATVTVASIALGLVVDDTIHILHRVVEARRAAAPPLEAVAHALRAVGRPVLCTWLALAVGFAAFVAAPFRPTRDFGLLVAATSVTAVLGDLVLLPALLLVRDRTRTPAREEREDLTPC
ncbi:MAG: MMPL family transporter [Planctomycetes bacterium]|nr:MMPL family transporter [Planctomycetota bacterium]